MFECKLCKLSFDSYAQLRNHTERFCVGSDYADPDEIERRVKREAASAAADFDRDVSFEEVKMFLRGGAATADLGDVSLAELQKHFKSKSTAVDEVRRELVVKLQEEKIGELKKLKADFAALRVQQEREEGDLLGRMRELEQQTRDEVRAREVRELTKRELEGMEGAKLRELEREKQRQLGTIELEQRALLDREQAIQSEIEQLRERLVSKQTEHRNVESQVSAAIRKLEGGDRKADTAMSAMTALAQRHGEQMERLRLQRERLLEEKSALEAGVLPRKGNATVVGEQAVAPAAGSGAARSAAASSGAALPDARDASASRDPAVGRLQKELAAGQKRLQQLRRTAAEAEKQAAVELSADMPLADAADSDNASTSAAGQRRLELERKLEEWKRAQGTNQIRAMLEQDGREKMVLGQMARLREENLALSARLEAERLSPRQAQRAAGARSSEPPAVQISAPPPEMDRAVQSMTTTDILGEIDALQAHIDKHGASKSVLARIALLERALETARPPQQLPAAAADLSLPGDARRHAVGPLPPAHSLYHAGAHQAIQSAAPSWLQQQMAALQQQIQQSEDENRRMLDELRQADLRAKKEAELEQTKNLESAIQALTERVAPSSRQPQQGKADGKSAREAAVDDEDAELLSMKRQHAREMAKMKFEMERLQQETRLEKLRAEMERTKRRTTLEVADETFVVLWDAVGGVPPEFAEVTVVYGLYDGANPKSNVRRTTASATANNVAVLDQYRSFVGVSPTPRLKLVVEVQGVTSSAQSQFVSLGWSLIEMFDVAGRLCSGALRVPLHVSSPDPSSTPAAVAQLDGTGSELFLRLCRGSERERLPAASLAILDSHVLYQPSPDAAASAPKAADAPSKPAVAAAAGAAAPAAAKGATDTGAATAAATSGAPSVVPKLGEAGNPSRAPRLPPSARNEPADKRSLMSASPFNGAIDALGAEQVDDSVRRRPSQFGRAQRAGGSPTGVGIIIDAAQNLSRASTVSVYCYLYSGVTQFLLPDGSPLMFSTAGVPMSATMGVFEWKEDGAFTGIDVTPDTSLVLEFVDETTNSMFAWAHVPVVSAQQERMQLLVGKHSLPILQKPVIVPPESPSKLQNARVIVTLFNPDESGAAVLDSARQPSQSARNGLFSRQSAVSLPDIFLENSRPANLTRAFTGVDGIDVYVDGLRVLPDQTTFTRIIGWVMSHDLVVAAQFNRLCSFQGDCYNPTLGARVEIRDARVDPTSCLLVQVNTVERHSGALSMVGQAVVHLFCDEDGQPWTKGVSRGAVYLNEGAFQLPLHRFGLRPGSKLTSTALDASPRVLAATALVRLAYAPLSTDGSHALSVDEVPDPIEQERVGLVVRAPPYSTRAYESSRAQPGQLERIAYRQQAKRGGLPVRVACAELSALLKKTAPSTPEEFEKWANELCAPNAWQLPPVDFNYAVKYEPRLGFKVAVDALRNLSVTNEFVRVFVSVAPPGSLYLPQPLTVGVNLSRFHDWTSPIKCPLFRDGLKWYKDESFDFNKVVVVDVRKFRPTRSGEFLMEPLCWGLLPVFSREQTVLSGCYQVPLWSGAIPGSVLERCRSQRPGEVLNDAVSSKLIRPMEWACAFVRIVDGFRDTEFDNVQQCMENPVQIWIPENRRKRYATIAKSKDQRSLFGKLNETEVADRLDQAVQKVVGM